MGVHDIGCFEQVVEQGFHAGTLGLLSGFPGRQKVFQHLGLPLLGILRVLPVPHGPQTLPAKLDKTLFLDVGQGYPGCLDVQLFLCLVRAVPAPGQEKLGIAAVVMRDSEEVLEFLFVHLVICNAGTRLNQQCIRDSRDRAVPHGQSAATS